MPRMRLLKLFALSVLLLTLLTTWETSWALPRPGSINWRGSPNNFITSLYWGVLGRAPESRQVVAGWATQVTSQPSSRLKVFWRFVSSAEFQRSRYAKQKRQFYVYRKSQRNSRRWDYFAAKYSQSGGQRIAGGPYTHGVAVALVGYYLAYHRTW